MSQNQNDGLVLAAGVGIYALSLGLTLAGSGMPQTAYDWLEACGFAALICWVVGPIMIWVVSICWLGVEFCKGGWKSLSE